jgi:hypothetical protein
MLVAYILITLIAGGIMFNKYLFKENQIDATYKGEKISICHIYKANGLYVGFDYANGKYGSARLLDVRDWDLTAMANMRNYLGV